MDDNNFEEIEKILKALSSKQRLQIVEYLLEGISDPNEIAKRLKLSDTTTSQHLNILQEAQIIEKSVLSTGGSRLILYKIRDNSKELIMTIQKACQDFSKSLKRQ